MKQLKNVFSIKKSFRNKLVFGLLIIVMVMGLVSLASYFVLKSVINQLHQMTEITILANSTLEPAENILELFKKYYVSKSNEIKVEIESSITKMKNNVGILNKLIEDGTGKAALAGLENIVKTYDEKAKKIMEISQNRKLTDTDSFDQIREDVMKNNSYIKDGVQQVINAELNYYQKTKANLNQKIKITGMVTLITIILVGFLSIAIAVLYLNKMIGAITKIMKAAQSIANGNLQIEQIKVDFQDEIGFLAEAFNKMSVNLRKLIETIHESSKKVYDSADFLNSCAKQCTQASEQIANTISEVSNGAAQQSSESNKTVNVIENLLNRNERISNNAFQVLYTSETASRASREGGIKLLGLIEQMQIINEEIQSTQTLMEILTKRSQDISVILTVINHIAEQSNLLALNAAIEAVKAGESGRGFSVVADEIYKLSEGSAEAAQKINGYLIEIQKETFNLSKRMNIGVEKVRDGGKYVEEMKANFAEIVNTSSNAEKSVKEIVGEIRNMVNEIKEVREISVNIACIAEQSSAGSQEVSASAQEQTTSMGEVSGLAAKLSQMAERLQFMVQQFKF